MGWREIDRSLGVASRAAEHGRVRRANTIERARQHVEQTADLLEAEIDRDLQQVVRYEQRLTQQPVSFGGMSYNPNTDEWSFQTLADNAGAVTWSIAAKFKSDATSSGITVTDGERVLELKAVLASRWGLMLAFSASQSGDAPATKLAHNRVFLVADGVSYRAIDGDLDAPVVIVAFPLPPHEPRQLSVEFDLETGPVRIDLPELANDAFETARTDRSLVDHFREKAHAGAASARAEIADARRKAEAATASSGRVLTCWMVLMALLLITWLSR